MATPKKSTLTAARRPRKWIALFFFFHLGDRKSRAHDGPNVAPGDDQPEGGLGGLHVHGRINERPKEGHADASKRLNRTVRYPPWKQTEAQSRGARVLVGAFSWVTIRVDFGMPDCKQEKRTINASTRASGM